MKKKLFYYIIVSQIIFNKIMNGFPPKLYKLTGNMSKVRSKNHPAFWQEGA